MLINNDRVIAIDLGNTRIKCGLVNFSSGICTFDYHFPAKDLSTSLGEYLKKIAALSGTNDTIPIVIAGNTPEVFNHLSQLSAALGFTCRHFQHKSTMPFSLDYENTPGADRLANALYATVSFPTHDHILISAGTAVTVDLILNNRFTGGTIFPGIIPQLKSLPVAAPALPMVSPDGPTPLPGKSTETCIRSGVLYTIAGGIEKIIASYRRIAPNALIHACGGDWPYLSPLVNETVMFNKYMTLSGIALSQRFI